MKEIDGFDETFWEYNYPVQVYPLDNGEGYYYIAYMPRKETCYTNTEEPLTKEQLTDFCNNCIEKLKDGIANFEALRDGKVDSIYYWGKIKEQKGDVKENG